MGYLKSLLLIILSASFVGCGKADRSAEAQADFDRAHTVFLANYKSIADVYEILAIFKISTELDDVIQIGHSLRMPSQKSSVPRGGVWLVRLYANENWVGTTPYAMRQEAVVENGVILAYEMTILQYVEMLGLDPQGWP